MSEERLERIENQLHQVLQVVVDLQQGQANLQQSQAALQQSQATLQQNQAALQQNQADIESKLDRSNADFLVYQKANQSVTNLAFSLIASATVITIVTNVFYRR
jgi:exonuclease VII small subunit